MNLITRLKTFHHRLHYRWLEDDLDEIQDMRADIRDHALAYQQPFPVAYFTLARTANDRLDRIARVAVQLHLAGVDKRDYAMGNFELGYSLVLAASGVLALCLALFGRL